MRAGTNTVINAARMRETIIAASDILQTVQKLAATAAEKAAEAATASAAAEGAAGAVHNAVKVAKTTAASVAQMPVREATATMQSIDIARQQALTGVRTASSEATKAGQLAASAKHLAEIAAKELSTPIKQRLLAFTRRKRAAVIDTLRKQSQEAVTAAKQSAISAREATKRAANAVTSATQDDAQIVNILRKTLKRLSADWNAEAEGALRALESAQTTNAALLEDNRIQEATAAGNAVRLFLTKLN